jgi:hypothetical protein
MYTTARLSTLIGAGLLAAIFGAGPAQAANSASQQPAPPHHDNGLTVVGYFRSMSDCQWVGQVGERQNRWDNPDCDQPNNGMYQNLWRLRVDRNSDNGWPGNGGQGGPGWPGNGGQGGPGWPGNGGQGGPGWPGNGGQGNGGHGNGGHGNGGQGGPGGHGGHGGM